MNYALRYKPLPDNVYNRLEREEAAFECDNRQRGRHMSFTLLPAIRTEGPLLPILGAPAGSFAHSLGPRRKSMR